VNIYLNLKTVASGSLTGAITKKLFEENRIDNFDNNEIVNVFVKYDNDLINQRMIVSFLNDIVEIKNLFPNIRFFVEND
jgi:hypothetical protein